MKFLLLLILSAPICSYSYPLIPNEDMTTGSLCTDDDPDFYEYRYQEEIPYCERHVSSGIKTKIYDAYKIPKKERADYTIDHFIPLSLGGTNHPDNLWPEHKKVKALRPDLEMKLYVALRDGKMDQETALEIIRDKKLHPKVAIGAETVAPNDPSSELGEPVDPLP